MENLEQFVDQLVEEKGFDEKDPEVIAQIKSDLLSRVEDRINATLIREFSEEDLTAFEKILDTATPEQAIAFAKEHITDLDGKIAGELVAFRATYLG